jgi:hypothetical protein
MTMLELHLVKWSQRKKMMRDIQSNRAAWASVVQYSTVAAKQSACNAFQYYGSTTHFNGFYL